MKKITLASLIFFLLFICGVFVASIFDKGSVIQPPLVNTLINQPSIDISNLQVNTSSSNDTLFTLTEVATHTSKNDCYLAINNNVYDVSSYIDYHPAGAKSITSRCGKEVTGIFASIHSNRAWDLLAKYKIGIVSGNKISLKPKILNAISDGLKTANPDAEILKVSAKNKFYIAKIILDGKLYEVHLNSEGKIFKEEIENEENDWSLWENDQDDK